MAPPPKKPASDRFNNALAEGLASVNFPSPIEPEGPVAPPDVAPPTGQQVIGQPTITPGGEIGGPSVANRVAGDQPPQPAPPAPQPAAQPAQAPAPQQEQAPSQLRDPFRPDTMEGLAMAEQDRGVDTKKIRMSGTSIPPEGGMIPDFSDDLPIEDRVTSDPGPVPADRPEPEPMPEPQEDDDPTELILQSPELGAAYDAELNARTFYSDEPGPGGSNLYDNMLKMAQTKKYPKTRKFFRTMAAIVGSIMMGPGFGIAMMGAARKTKMDQREALGKLFEKANEYSAGLLEDDEANEQARIRYDNERRNISHKNTNDTNTIFLEGLAAANLPGPPVPVMKGNSEEDVENYIADSATWQGVVQPALAQYSRGLQAHEKLRNEIVPLFLDSDFAAGNPETYKEALWQFIQGAYGGAGMAREDYDSGYSAIAQWIESAGSGRHLYDNARQVMDQALRGANLDKLRSDIDLSAQKFEALTDRDRNRYRLGLQTQITKARDSLRQAKSSEHLMALLGNIGTREMGLSMQNEIRGYENDISALEYRLNQMDSRAQTPISRPDDPRAHFAHPDTVDAYLRNVWPQRAAAYGLPVSPDEVRSMINDPGPTPSESPAALFWDHYVSWIQERYQYDASFMGDLVSYAQDAQVNALAPGNTVGAQADPPAWDKYAPDQQ